MDKGKDALQESDDEDEFESADEGDDGTDFDVEKFPQQKLQNPEGDQKSNQSSTVGLKQDNKKHHQPKNENFGDSQEVENDNVSQRTVSKGEKCRITEENLPTDSDSDIVSFNTNDPGDKDQYLKVISEQGYIEDDRPSKVDHISKSSVDAGTETQTSESENNKIQEDSPERSEEEDDNEESWNDDGWGWGTWGSIVSKATSSVSTFMENVESQLGIPDPKDMAKAVKEDEAQVNDSPCADERKEDKGQTAAEAAGGGFSSWFSGFGVSTLSNMVQNTSKDLMSGGIDALEYIGKKTMDVLSEGDPGLKKKRGILTGSGDQPTLSQVLREAREKEDSDQQLFEPDSQGTSFYVEFEKFQGLAHLEALEMLSNESETKLDRILSAQTEEAYEDSKELLISIKNNFHGDSASEEEEDFEDLGTCLSDEVEKLSINLKIDKILSTEARLKAAIASLSADKETSDDPKKPEEVFSVGITGFAELTARSVELFKKTGELLLVQDVHAKQKVNDRAKSLRVIAGLMKGHISWLSSKYAESLNATAESHGNSKDSGVTSKLITDIYLEGSNSSSYIEDSHRLLLPILQFSAIR